MAASAGGRWRDLDGIRSRPYHPRRKHPRDGIAALDFKRNRGRVLFYATRVTKISRTSVKDPIKDIDDARLRPHLRAQRPELKPHLIVQPDNGINHIQTFNAHAQASPGDLRGIPVIGEGVGGVSPGTNPASALEAKESREERRVA